MLNLYDRMVMDATNSSGSSSQEKKYFKHLGILSSDNAPVVIIFKMVPGEPNNCLVVGPNFLNSAHRDALMRSLESNEGQKAFDLGISLATRKFPDGPNMLAFLHEENYIKKIPTKDVIVTYGPDKNGRISLDKLNELIAEEMNMSLDELSVREEKPKEKKSSKKYNAKEAAKE